MRIFTCKGEKLLKRELKGDFNFFIKEANTNPNSKGYGLIRDKNKLAPEIASIASVGYGLAALVIGVERNWISYPKAYNRANRTLETFLNNMEETHGFFYHFINMETAKREWNSEVSIIDTGIFICGDILAGEYFKGGVKEKAEQLYQNINWNWYRDENTNQFYMGYLPENGFFGHWDMYAEECIGIDKGISMIMIENYLTGLIWKYFMKNKYVINGLEKLNITQKNRKVELV